MPDLMIDYELKGRVLVPEGSKLNETGTGVILPDGRVMKIWEQVELFDEEAEEHTNLSHDECCEQGIFYDGDMADLQIVGEVNDGDQVWPPTGDEPVHVPGLNNALAPQGS